MATHRTSLLLLTSVPVVKQRIDDILKVSTKCVEKVLYVHFDTGHFQNAGKNKNKCTLLPNTKELRKTVAFFYGRANQLKDLLDVRILLSDAKSRQSVISLQHQCDIVLTDYPGYSDASFSEYVKNRFNKGIDVKISHLGNVEANNSDPPSYMDTDNSHSIAASTSTALEEVSEEIYDHTVMGGTFDRLHAGHKILLNEACLRTRKRLTIGVTVRQMIAKKELHELIEPIEVRMEKLLAFLNDVDPTLEYNLEPIIDPFGPSIVLPELQCIVTSDETKRGGEKVNEVRQSKGLSVLALHTVCILDETCQNEIGEDKISSSNTRKRLLGTLLKVPQNNAVIQSHPYVIGLTGGIASGKSKICQRLNKLGAAIISCDELGHEVYVKGQPVYYKIIEEFGTNILTEEGLINRKSLGATVFADSEKLHKLNSIVWPALAHMIKEKIGQLREQGSRVVAIDAAVLLEAGWNKFVHEVWLAIIPRSEAISRVRQRDNLDEAAAIQRIDAQMTSEERLAKANVVICSLWANEVTDKQVKRAWSNLLVRLGDGSKI
ncbi:PREDICTED: bifunctional coenzyme A synthase-like [Priapulus caudatus]|uniref:Bifunctional coenzyme A synthase-like n=1 Tax=Priapulus caudatus TaxID=37621 RepID=A0ABM1FA34_PRICU|nr:PREDICTED: bifunctional coenzyme A synthase-like [Priapulus caudatus]XP_014681305.1 PREDICTED: bifunctional coenzyme A synthase-like [Priapulus caudatus]